MDRRRVRYRRYHLRRRQRRRTHTAGDPPRDTGRPSHDRQLGSCAEERVGARLRGVRIGHDDEEGGDVGQRQSQPHGGEDGVVCVSECADSDGPHQRGVGRDRRHHQEHHQVANLIAPKTLHRHGAVHHSQE